MLSETVDESKESFVVNTENLTKKFGNFTAVNNLNLKIKKGEIYGLIGPNGAGKTTTIKMLCGLLSPTSGKAYVLGREIPDKGIAPFIGYMPQETALYLGLTVHENVKFYGEIFGLEKEKILGREKNLLKFIGLERWRDEFVENLSGGMKHRLSLACSLIHEPKLLFLDEPTVGVDPELRVSFWKYFNKLKEEGITILITTHYMDEAQHCDRIGMMMKGHLIAEGVPQHILSITHTNSLEDAFLKFSRHEVEL
ncbi:MAG: ABC transporter ATP-binding protein [Thermoplasmata archaeon]|nr:MAG: ABC transporter ATP-binding protein [Thermoplasmata archaeon]